MKEVDIKEAESFTTHPVHRHLLVGTLGTIKYDRLYYNTQIATKRMEQLRIDFPTVVFQNEGYLSMNATIAPHVHKHFLIHRLVADTYCSKPKSSEPLFVNHKDGNKHNNVVSNLEWVTCLDNNRHFVDNLRTDAQMGFLYDKVTVYQYTLDGELIETYSTLSAIKERHGYSIGRISVICNKEDVRKLYKGYFWSYVPISNVPIIIRQNLDRVFSGNVSYRKIKQEYHSRIVKKGVVETIGPFKTAEETKSAYIDKWLVLYRQQYYSSPAIDGGVHAE